MKYILTILLFFQFANCEAQIRKHQPRPVILSAGGVPQSKALWNEDLTNAVWAASPGVTIVTANQHIDFLGNNTLEQVDIGGGGSELYQEVTVNAGTNYTVTFDAAGVGATAHYRVAGFSSCFCELVASTEYGSALTNTTSQVSFTVNSGSETLLRIYLNYNETVSGTVYLGRLWVREAGKTYATTTTTAVN